MKKIAHGLVGALVAVVLMLSVSAYLVYSDKVAWVRASNAMLQVEGTFSKVHCNAIRYKTWNSDSVLVIGNGGLTRYGTGGLLHTTIAPIPSNSMTWGIDNDTKGSPKEDKRFLTAEMCRGAVYDELGIFDPRPMPLSAVSRMQWYVPEWTRTN